MTRGLPPPDPHSLCPQLNLLNPPHTKFLGTPLHMLEVMNIKFHDNLKAYSRAPKPIPRRTVFCHKMPQYCYLLSQCSKFCSHSSLCCFSTDVYCCVCDVQLCWLFNGGYEGTTHLHWVLLHTWEAAPYDKTWVYCHDPAKKQQSSKWKCLSFAHTKQQSRSGATSTGCWQPFLTVKALFFSSFFLHARRLTSITTVRFYKSAK